MGCNDMQFGRRVRSRRRNTLHPEKVGSMFDRIFVSVYQNRRRGISADSDADSITSASVAVHNKRALYNSTAQSHYNHSNRRQMKSVCK
jgi:single-stranded DNA-specific DHH superfamily exonuclease